MCAALAIIDRFPSREPSGGRFPDARSWSVRRVFHS